jgi:hypothetical protein
MQRHSGDLTSPAKSNEYEVYCPDVENRQTPYLGSMRWPGQSQIDKGTQRFLEITILVFIWVLLEPSYSLHILEYAVQLTLVWSDR